MNKSELISKKKTLQIEKMKLDRFFSMYLDKFGSKMDHQNPNTKIWTLYKSKLNEYEEVSRQLKHIDYWIAKNV